MTNEEILKAAIKKAEENGWKLREQFLRSNVIKYAPEIIIFDKKFARAFWGEDVVEKPTTDIMEICGDGLFSFDGEVWKFHLMNMILEKEPLKYLKKFL